MENASKALIIAGAILIAIVLVSLGVLVINNSRKDINDKNLDEVAIQTFNRNITQYCGKNKSATDVTNILNAVVASNGDQQNKADKHYIDFDFRELRNGTAADLTGKYFTYTRTTFYNFSDLRKYELSYTIDETGYVNSVVIKN